MFSANTHQVKQQQWWLATTFYACALENFDQKLSENFQKMAVVFQKIFWNTVP